MSPPAKRRRKAASLAYEAAFRARITELGGQVFGEWVDAHTPIACTCGAGHSCSPRPNNVMNQRGMCLICSGKDRAVAETKFRTLVEEWGGQDVGPYINVDTGVDCICPLGHPCALTPYNFRQGNSGCKICSGLDSPTAARQFHDRLSAQGCRAVGPYVNVMTPVLCVCKGGHLCMPTPNNIQRGQGACAACAGKVWDAFYVVINPAEGRVKFGITSGDPGGRLAVHQRAGYTEIVRSLPGIAAAAALERHVIATLRDAGVLAVRGREHFDISALPLVLDIVDGWTLSAAA